MVYHGGQFLALYYFCYIFNDFRLCSTKLDFHLFADDSNLFYAGKSLTQIESVINAELTHVETWLSANKLSLTLFRLGGRGRLTPPKN